MPTTLSVRQTALLKILSGLVIYAMAFYAILQEGLPYPATYGVFGLTLSAAPMLPLLMGLVEFIFNVPFREVASRWDALPGWQRGVLGMLVVVAAFGIAVGLFLLAVYYELLA